MALSTQKTTRNLVIYQVFTRNYKDGTFRAVEEDLERIQALGADYVYLLPIQPSGTKNRKGSMGSPYAIRDYRAIDPVQGTMEDFVRLTESVHARGMKIMIDVVYNHTAPDSWLAENHPEWFYHKPDGSFGNRIGDWWDVIDLDYSNPGLWEYQIDTLKLWARYVDGFRCDVAPMIPLEFWRQAREAVAQIRPDCLWLAESVEPEMVKECRAQGIPMSSDGELYQVFDILYDYDIYHKMVGVATGKNSLSDYLERVNLQEAVYPENFCKLRCLENHDRPRAAALYPEQGQLLNWTAWNYFANGAAMLYMGQEYRAEHHPTLFDRDTVDFAPEWDISPFLAALAEIKRAPIFAQGSFTAQAIGKDQDVIFAVRQMQGSKCVGIFSTTARRQPLTADLPNGTYRNLLTGGTIDVFEKTFLYSGSPAIFYVEE